MSSNAQTTSFDSALNAYLCGAMLVFAFVIVGLLYNSCSVPLHGQNTTPGNYPCSMVAGCTAAHSLGRRIVATYTGPFFQLTRASDATTADIGQTATGFVNMAQIASFCAATTCYFQKVYDQTANASTLTREPTSALIPYHVDAVRGWPTMLGGIGIGYMNSSTTPANNPTGAVDKSVVLVTSDLLVDNTSSPYGLAHGTGEPLDPGSTFMPTAMVSSVTDNRVFRNWFESDDADVVYGTYQNSSYTDGNAMSARGDFVGIATYVASTKVVLEDFNGEYVYSVVYPTPINNDHEIHLNHGGDAVLTPGYFYEGLVYNIALTTGQREVLQRNIQSFYGITFRPSCSNGPRPPTIVDVLGSDSLVDSGFHTVAWTFGLRVVNPHWVGPIVTLFRTGDSAYKSIGAKGCDLDIAAAHAFCAPSSCQIEKLYNQTRGINGVTNFTSPDNLANLYGSPRPAYTENCLGAFPCITFTSASERLNLDDFRPYASPFSLVVLGKNNATSFGRFLWTASNDAYLGGGPTGGNQVLFQAGGGSATATATNNAWGSFGGVTPDASHVIAYVNGVGTSAAQTVTPSTHNTAVGTDGGVNTVNIAEVHFLYGYALSAAQMATISAGHHSYYGF
jgi:hypothetical protein